MRLSINDHAAFETRAHAAERSTLFAGDGSAAAAQRYQDCDGDTCASLHADLLPIYAYGDHPGGCSVAMHGLPPEYVAMEGMALTESQVRSHQCVRESA
jgi:hypothetical protein